MKKKIFLSVSSFLLLLLGNSLFGQCIGSIPTTADLIALPTTGTGAPACPTGNFITTTNNTGTDVYFDGTNNCQVMVWDGTNASLSWKYGTVTGSVPFSSFAPLGGSALTDPDVVVNAESGTVFAMLVGEVASGSNAGKIFWASFKWSGNFSTINTSGFLGDVVTNGTCKNPNIDVNSCGRVALAWYQRATYNITITTSGGPSGFNFGPIAIPVLRADVFTAQGFLDGTSCTGSAVLGGVTTASGDRASGPSGATHLFESNINPDVCISDASNNCASGNYIISIAYINQWFDASTFKIVGQVITRQFKGPDCANGLAAIFTFNDNGYTGGRPRIASRPVTGGSNYGDFQVVMADPSTSCNAGGPPCQLYSTKVYNWGQQNGVAGPLSPAAPNTLNIAPVNFCDLSTSYNSDAVVTYRSTLVSTTGDFIVAWTNGGGLTNVVANDVVARTFNQSGTNLAATGSTQFSIVNGGCNGRTGNQYLPSIAGRYSKFVGYQFYDNASSGAKPYIGYKLSDKNPGSTTALRMPDNLIPGYGAATESFEVQPNPFTDEIAFKIALAKENRASQIEISDAGGHLLKTINLANNDAVVKWKTGAALNAGIYYAKLYTTKGYPSDQVHLVKPADIFYCALSGSNSLILLMGCVAIFSSVLRSHV